MSNNIHPKRRKLAQEKHLSDNKAPQIKYDVFVSFRGEIRRGFLSHLVDAFKRNHINVFVDNILQRGDEIGPSLDEAIEGSFISLIIFSLDYASSRWCLDELVRILECRKKYKRIVIPVFYYVEPTDVRHQSHTYKNAFDEHEKNYETTKVKSWRDALNKSANISGIAASKFQDDKELIDKIINDINLELKNLAKSPVDSKRLIAIDEKVATVESLLRKEPEGNDTCRVIGIWGMGGIGKTTLAKEVFNKLKSGYNGSCFLADEREQYSEKHGITSLKKFIFSKLLGCPDVEIEESDSVPDHIVSKTSRMKVLIVLDDVDDPKHPEQLLGALTNFAQGSIIIITTRYKQVLQTSMANETYHLTELGSNEALELFNSKAFEQRDDRWEEYKDLSKRVVNYAQGVPLVLTVLAGHLRGNPNEMWEGELDKLAKRPPGEVYEVMIRSYDGLDSEQQQIFLDLACFFLRLHHKINVSDLEFLLLKDDESGKSVHSDLRRLEQKALITLSEDNWVSMHDVLKEMALKIARGEPIRDLGSRNRLWDPEDIYEVLKTGKVSEDIRSIQIHFSKIKELKSIPEDIFAKMSRLQFLAISGIYKYHLIEPHCILAKRLQSLPSELRFLYWDHYPLQSLPESFSADGVKNLVNLKVVDVSGSQKLKKLQDLSKATNLEVLNTYTCESLHTIGKLPHSLKTLNVCFCTSLQTLLELPPLLETLDAYGCKYLHTIEKLPHSLKTLNVDSGTSFRTPPELSPLLKTLNGMKGKSIWNVRVLQTLDGDSL